MLVPGQKESVETARMLEVRLKEHQNRSNSALHEHITTTGHSISPGNTKILTSEDHTLKRKVKEAIKIKQRRPTLNRDEGLELPNIYSALLLARD